MRGTSTRYPSERSSKIEPSKLPETRLRITFKDRIQVIEIDASDIDSIYLQLNMQIQSGLSLIFQLHDKRIFLLGANELVSLAVEYANKAAEEFRYNN